MKKITSLFFLIFIVQVSAQGDYKSDFWYGGLSFNKYVYGLTPFDIYAYDINHLESNTNKYKGLNYAPGLVLGRNIGTNSVKGKIEYTFNRKVANSSYSMMNLADSSIFKVDEKLKLTYAYVKVGVSLPFNRFCIGGSIDLGVFNNRIKRKGGSFSGNWEKFLTQTGLTNDYRARSFTGGLSLYASAFLTNNLQLSISRQFLMLDADFNRLSDLQGFSINVQHYQVSLSFTIE